MDKNFDELTKRLEQSATKWQALRKFGIGLAGVVLACVGQATAWADWTPPESSVRPPAVVTLDAFAAPGASNGAYPLAALVAGPDGALYGSTQSGGTNNFGTLFQLQTNGAFTKLHDFNGRGLDIDFSYSGAALVVGPDGALYGVVLSDGANRLGILFRVETNGTFTKLYDFNGTNGAYPLAGLVVGPDGALYGSTIGGGNYGTLFRAETNGTFSKLHDFSGSIVSSALVVGPDGALYGSAWFYYYSSSSGLFRFQTNGSYTNLHNFSYTDDNNNPSALVVGPDGALYGSTQSGGTGERGTLFRVETNGTFTKLHDFNGTNGAYPETALVVGPDGALYGSTSDGGTNGGYGTLFRVEANGSFTKLHDFNGVDGAGPYAAMVVGPDSTALYGSTQVGGASGKGTLFRMETNATFTKLHDFNGTNGAYPSAALVVGPDGRLYGSTSSGGTSNYGILFKIVVNRPPVARCHDVTVSAGANCAADASVENGSFDPDAGDTIAVRQEPPGPYPLGVTPVTLTVTDNHGASASCMARVTVIDTTAPTIGDVTVTQIYRMVEVTLNYTARDDCAGVTNVLTVVPLIAGKERGDESQPDWVVEDDHHVLLRAGGGTGRVYTITIISTDAVGNSSTRIVTVTVPKSQGK